MKAKTTATKNTTFQPFDLVITVETRAEAEMLWAIFNAPVSVIEQMAKKFAYSGKLPKLKWDSMSVFTVIDEKLK